MGKFYLTTAIDYVNDLPHLGTAFEKIAADCFARFHRLKGDDVLFLMGTDEHSQNVEQRAQREGLEPRAFCDRMAARFQETWKRLFISCDDFIRTTDARHVDTVKDLLSKIHARGDIYKGKYRGWYCVSCESFLAEGDLVDGNCKTHQKKPDWIEEENYFFALSRYRDQLLEHLERHPEFVQPEIRKNEVRQVLLGGLQDVSISRTGTQWGIPLPFDPGTVTYVWFDALINYVSGAGYSSDRARFARYWPADCHVIGKDITRFHCIIWPAMLLSAGIELPRQVYAHGFVYFKGQKLSKSRGVYVDPLEAAELFGPDALRYFLLREVSFGQDGDFTWERFADRFNADLANDLGNLVNRVQAVASKDLGGTIRRPADPLTDPLDRELADKAREVQGRYVERLDAFEPHQALAAVWELVRLANTYVERTAPWTLARPGGDRARLEAVLYNLAEAVRWIAVLVAPVMPEKADRILSALGIAESVNSCRTAAPGKGLAALAAWGGPERFEGIVRGEPLFPRIDKTKLSLVGSGIVDAVKELPHAGAAPAPKAPAAAGPPAQVTIDEFFRVDLRVGTIQKAEAVKGAKKLLRLEVLVGSEVRQLVAGIAEHYKPEELVGQQIAVVANLQPAKIRGVESQGMLLAATGADGKVAILQPRYPVESGSKIK